MGGARLSSALLVGGLWTVAVAASVTAASTGAGERWAARLTFVPPGITLEAVPTGDAADAVAWGTFDNQIHSLGFGYLEIYTNETYPDTYQAFAAGLLEGFLTKELISMHYNNTERDYCNEQNAYCARLYQFLQKNLDYVNLNIKKFRRQDPYWFQTELAFNQLQGLQNAWSSGNDQIFFKLPSTGYTSVTPILFLNIDGDLEDLEQALHAPKFRKDPGSGHCSALVKVLPENHDLLVSHVTWSGYSTMLRILKKYSFGYRKTWMGDAPISAQNMTFSSSPGRIFSGDDFHLLSSGLVTMETTIGNSNDALWTHVTPLCNLEWMRTIVANRLATDGLQWATLFAREASGSYNNQWMIIDYKRFTPGKPIEKGTLTVLEEIPGIIKYGDQSDILANQTYWPSYNVPYYEAVYNASGWPKKAAQFGDWFTYEKNPRAQIFRRDHSRVTNLLTMLQLMRYNDYTHDPLSRCNCTPPYSAENAISARCDLNPANGTYPFSALGHRSHGATDAKITSASLFAPGNNPADKPPGGGLTFMAVAGPTHDPLPPFTWSRSGLADPHEGHPDVWKFPPHVHVWNDR